MKAIWNGVVLAESSDTVIVDGNHYFPAEAVNRSYTSFSNHRSSSEKGQAQYQSLLVNGEFLPDALWSYPEPTEAFESIRGRWAFGVGVMISD